MAAAQIVRQLIRGVVSFSSQILVGQSGKWLQDALHFLHSAVIPISELTSGIRECRVQGYQC